ncbi:hypothetical protein ACFW04_011896 [Cataglyphis niger]
MHQVPHRTERGGTSSEGRNDRNSWKKQQQQQQQLSEYSHNRVLQQPQQPSRSCIRARARVGARARARRSSKTSGESADRTTATRRQDAGPDVVVRESLPLHYLGPARTVYGSAAPFLPSNLLLIGLVLCCLALPAVQPRLSGHYQTCPGCPHQQPQHQHHHHHHHMHHDGSARSSFFKDTAVPSPDDLRLEAIKHQILQKLGLRTRPDVNRTLATVPRLLALETLSRAEAQMPPRYSDRSRVDYDSDYSGEFLYGGDEYSYRNLDQETTTTEGNARTTARSYQGYDNVQEMDDFYARTSEIITFAEPGKFTLVFFLWIFFKNFSLDESFSKTSLPERLSIHFNKDRLIYFIIIRLDIIYNKSISISRILFARAGAKTPSTLGTTRAFFRSTSAHPDFGLVQIFPDG